MIPQLNGNVGTWWIAQSAAVRRDRMARAAVGRRFMSEIERQLLSPVLPGGGSYGRHLAAVRCTTATQRNAKHNYYTIKVFYCQVNSYRGVAVDDVKMGFDMCREGRWCGGA